MEVRHIRLENGWLAAIGNGASALRAYGDTREEAEQKVISMYHHHHSGQSGLLPAVWRVLEKIYGAKHKEPILFDSLPPDLQEALNNLLEIVGKMGDAERERP